MQGKTQKVKVKRTNFYIPSFMLKIQEYMHSMEINMFTYLRLFSLSIFLHSNLGSIRCSLIRGNHSYQVAFTIYLRVCFSWF